NIVSYAQLRMDTHSDLFGTALVIPKGAFVAPIPGVFPGYPATDTPVGFATVRSTEQIPGAHQRTFTDEFRLEGKAANGKLDWQTGFYYENATPMGFVGSQSPVFIGCKDSDNFICTDLTGAGVINYTVAKVSTRTIGLYVQSTYALTDKLK